MAKSDARFGYQSNLNREAHDLSRPFAFTCCPGMLCPIFADFASPGDTYFIEHDLDLLRTAPLVAPAMIDVIVHYESFFVPIQMIYQPAENTFFSLKNLQSNFYDSTTLLNNVFPLFNMEKYVGAILSGGMGSSFHQLSFRMADFLGLNPAGFAIDNFQLTQSGNVTGDTLMPFWPSFFPWQILAYHTIFQYYYRLDDKTQFNQLFCNWDSFYGSVEGGNYNGHDSVYYMQSQFMTIYQRPWDFDYFTSMYRSAIVSGENLQDVLPQGEYSDLASTRQLANNFNNGYVTGNSEIVGYRTYGSSVNNSTSLIRQIFANEKLAMITGRTRKNYDSQVLAHYGVQVPHDVKHDLTCIGHDEYDLKVGEVTSLADTSSATLGDLAGKGFATGKGKKHKFTCPTHGVIMTIFSIEPKKRYFGGFERQNAVVDAFDFPVPEFDRLGNQPMYRYETGLVNVLGQQPGDLVGWKERYYPWKRRSPKATLAFMKGFNNQYNPDVNQYESYFITSVPFGKQMSATSRPDLSERFYIEPAVMNPQVLMHYVPGWMVNTAGEGEEPTEDWNTHPWLVYVRDPFIVNSKEQVTKVSWMSKDGEPIYPW